MPVMRFTKFLALSVDQRARIPQSALETDVWLFFLNITRQSFIYDILLRITLFYERHSLFFVVIDAQVMSLLK